MSWGKLTEILKNHFKLGQRVVAVLWYTYLTICIGRAPHSWGTVHIWVAKLVRASTKCKRAARINKNAWVSSTDQKFWVCECISWQQKAMWTYSTAEVNCSWAWRRLWKNGLRAIRNTKLYRPFTINQCDNDRRGETAVLDS